MGHSVYTDMDVSQDKRTSNRFLLTDKQQFRGVLPSPLLGLGVSE